MHAVHKQRILLLNGLPGLHDCLGRVALSFMQTNFVVRRVFYFPKYGLHFAKHPLFDLLRCMQLRAVTT